MSRRQVAEVAIAGALARAGCYGEAAWTLASVLATYSPTATAPDEVLADAATVYLIAAHAEPGCYPAPLQWARYAYVTYRDLRGVSDARTLRAGVRYAELLRERGLPHDAVRVGRQLLAAHTPRTGAMGGDAVTAWHVLAVSLHAAGQCGQARAVITEAWWSRRTGPGDDTGESTEALLVAMCAMEARCWSARQPDWLTSLLQRFPAPARYAEMLEALRQPTATCDLDAVRHRRICADRRPAAGPVIRRRGSTQVTCLSPIAGARP